VTISRKTLHAARESLQIIMGNIELSVSDLPETKRKEAAQKAKAEVLKLAKLLGAEKLAE